MSLFAPFELSFDARGFAEGNAFDDLVEFFVVERRLARLRIPGAQ